MKITKIVASVILAAVVVSVPVMISGCSKPDDEEEVEPEPEPEPTPDPEPEKPDYSKYEQKPRICWIDAHANFEKLYTEELANKYLDKIQGAEFNGFVLDVKPCDGTAHYASSIVPQQNRYYNKDRNYDYVNFFIQQAKERKMTITLSNTLFSWGTAADGGAVAKDPELEKRICVENLQSGLVRMDKDKNQSIIFLNPADPYVQNFVKSVIEEQLKLYGNDIDGFALDYCRYPDLYSDFSDTSKELFEKYIGKTVENFPADIYSYDSNGSIVRGTYYKQWWEWRSTVIRNFISEVKDLIKKYNPNISVQLWSPSWWSSRYQVGQNWADPSNNSTKFFDWATTDYYKTGFADLLDVFHLGAYLSKVYPNTDSESISYAVTAGKRLINGKCKMYGTFSVASLKFPTQEATWYCLENSDGIMVFDLVYVDRYGWYDEIKAAVDSAKADGGAYIIPSE